MENKTQFHYKLLEFFWEIEEWEALYWSFDKENEIKFWLSANDFFMHCSSFPVYIEESDLPVLKVFRDWVKDNVFVFADHESIDMWKCWKTGYKPLPSYKNEYEKEVWKKMNDHEWMNTLLKEKGVIE